MKSRIVSGSLMMCIKHSVIIAPERLEVKSNVEEMHHLYFKIYKSLLPFPHFDRSETLGLRAAEAQVMKVSA